MFTVVVKVLPMEGHRIKSSFNESVCWNFTKGNDVRVIRVDNADLTGSNFYSLLTVTRNNEVECWEEINGQIYDGYFENYRTCGFEFVARY